jgi:hypothetical protein
VDCTFEGFLRYRLLEFGDPGKVDASLKGYRRLIVSPFVRLSADNPGKVIVLSFVPGKENAKEFPVRNKIRKTYE